ncbi:hypothetical protein LTR36_002895 [Oleoguttula mirabilis]|uniref:Cytochrome P450 n=1 Tax=Oleoguttula mirabilis TaxID=1507867 RepID=A0AAV9JJW6_9PEZI|nr:hypothetical protein LTR36_002895 [Oleoguttula mirabilis]
MALWASPLLWTIVALPLLYRLVSSFLSERRFKAFAKAHGCEPVYKAQDQKWPWGLDRMYAVLTARKRGEDPLDHYFAPPLYEHHTLERALLGGAQIIETIEPANVKTMLATNFDEWVIGEYRHRAFRAVQGYNIFTSDGPFWQHSRAMFRPQFSRDLVNDLEATERATSVLFEAIGPTDEKGWTTLTNIKPLLFRFVLDTATEFLFGESIESQKALMLSRAGTNDEEHDIGRIAGSNEFAEAFDTCSYFMVLRIRLQQLYFLGNTKEFRKAVAIISSVPNRILKHALQYGRDDQKQRKYDLLSSLMEQTRDVKELQAQTLGILFASRDTTSSLLLWTVLLLGQNPSIYKKLRETVLQRFAQPSGAILDFAELKDCRYLQHVLLESMRLYQPVPLNSRVAVKDTVLPIGGGADGLKPIAIRQGQQVLWNIYAMHRRTDLWGEDALEYKPERWEDPKRSRLLGGGWLYTPFSGGPRICIGQQYAMTEASYCLVRLLQRYDAIELDPDSGAAKHEHIKKTIGVTLAPVELNLRLHETQK